MLPKKILFMSVPGDGHFNPLTGLAIRFKLQGHDVRWYVQDLYKDKLQKLGIPHYPHVKAPQLNQHNFEDYFTERASHKSLVAKFRFDLEHVFVRPSADALSDVESIYKEFRFDLVIGDIFCFSLPLIKEKLQVPVVAVGVIPVSESSKDLPPAGLGLTPSFTRMGRIKQHIFRFLTDKLVLRKPGRVYRSILKQHGVDIPEGNLFDIMYRSLNMVWQSGTPGFEYLRNDWNPKLRFIGPLLPIFRHVRPFSINKQMKFDKVVLVTQGTVEKDTEKIIAPTLEAFKNTNTLVIATTGGNGTMKLRERFPQPNFIIEDFIPFCAVMSCCNVYITNGGYGGVLLSIQHKLPMVVAGLHEGKNEICARVDYHKLGINLKTEKPKPAQIRKAVDTIFHDQSYKKNVTQLALEFKLYNPESQVDRCMQEIFGELPVIAPAARMAG